jgi:hypothetical protein
MGEIYFSETSVGFFRITQRYIPADSHRCENLESNPVPIIFKHYTNIRGLLLEWEEWKGGLAVRALPVTQP